MGTELVSSRFFERFPVSHKRVVEMLDRHCDGRADVSLCVRTVYNAVARLDKSREVHVA